MRCRRRRGCSRRAWRSLGGKGVIGHKHEQTHTHTNTHTCGDWVSFLQAALESLTQRLDIGYSSGGAVAHMHTKCYLGHIHTSHATNMCHNTQTHRQHVLRMSHTCRMHTSRVTHQTSHVTRHTSRVTMPPRSHPDACNHAYRDQSSCHTASPQWCLRGAS